MSKLHSKFEPTDDQPQAIEYLVNGINKGEKYQTLLGVTGSWENFHHGKYNTESSKTNAYISSQQDFGADSYILNSKSSSQRMLLSILYHSISSIENRSA